MGMGEFSGKPDERLEGYLVMDQCPIQGGVVILLVTLCNMETGISSGWVDQ